MSSSPKGLFLPAAGRGHTGMGSSTSIPAGNFADTDDNYWSTDANGGSEGFALLFEPNISNVTNRSRKYGNSVRCVKGTKQ